MSIKFKYAMKKFLLPLIIFLLLIPLAKAVSDKNTTTTTTTITETTTITITEPSDKSDKIIKKQEDIFEKVKTVDTSMKFFGTEYTAEEPATIWLQLLRNYQPLNNATCYITAYQPNKTIFLNKTLMNYLDGSDGVYYYDLTAPSILGVYMLSANCKIPSDAFIDDFLNFDNLESWKNITITNNKILISNISGELPNYKGIDNTANMSGNVLLYHLNEPSGAIVDYSGEENNGTTSGVSYSLNGVFDKAVQFLTTSYINAGNKTSLNTRNAITVSFWINTTSQVVNAYPFYKGGTSFYTNPYNTMRFYLVINGSVRYINTGTYATNEWHHIVGTYDKDAGIGNFRIYLDGILQSSASYSGQIADTSAYNLYLGSQASAYGWSGLMDEVAIWNRSLLATEILGLFNRTKIILTTEGYVQSKPINLSDSSWVNFSSGYNLNSGNITFKILDQNNNTLCTGLGSIQTCADATSPIKLYAKLTRSENLTSPEIDRWWVSWLLSSFEEIKGAGEMHVSTTGLTNETINEITDDVIIKMLQNARILNQRVVNFHNQQYCIDNSTLRHNITYDYCVGNNCKVMKDIMDEICQYDCNYQLSVCNKPPYQNALVIAGGIAGFIVFILVVLRLAGRI
jgi:hypothetical protein